MVTLDCFEGVGGRAANRARWLGHVRACADEGLSAAAYCRREGLALGNFYRGRGVFRASGAWAGSGDGGKDGGGDGGTRALFAAVSLGGGVEALEGSGIEVVVSGTRRVRVHAGFDAATLARVVAALEGASC